MNIFEAWIGGRSPVDGSENWTSELTIHYKRIFYHYNGKGTEGFLAAYDDACSQALFQFYGYNPQA